MQRRLVCFIAVGLLVSVLTIAEADTFAPRWQLYRVTTWSATVEPPALAFDVTWVSGAGVLFTVYTGSDRDSGAFAFFGARDLRLDLASDTVDPDAFVIRTGAGSANAGAVVPANGTVYVLALWAGDIRSLTPSLEASGEYFLLAEGPAHQDSGNAFDGPAFADAAAFDAGAQVSADREMSFDITGNLYGWFLQPAIGVNVGTALMTSADHVDECTAPDDRARLPLFGCVYSDMSGTHRRGPGHYTFSWTGARAGAGDTPPIAWADIPWPPSA